MQTNAEFDRINHVTIEAGSDMELFAMFNIELSDGSMLLDIKPRTEPLEMVVDEKRKVNLAKYIERGFAFEAPPLEDYVTELVNALKS